MKRFLYLSILIAVVSTLSCGGNKCPYCSEFLDVEATKYQSECSLPDVEVFIDATYSMRGFAKAAAKDQVSRFKQFLDTDKIEEFLSNAFGSSSLPTYFVLKDTVKDLTTTIVEDTAIQRLPDDTLRQIDRGVLRLKIQDPSFFNGFANDYIYVFNHIKNDLKEGDTNKMYILISDLFQTDNDLTKLSSVIKNIISNYNVSIAIVGIKLPFDGVIYDITKKFKRVNYNGDRNVFYLIVGKKCQIIKFVKSLPLREDEHYVIFSRDIIDSLKIESVESKNIKIRGYTYMSFCGERKDLVDTINIRLRWYADEENFVGSNFKLGVVPYIDAKDGCKAIMEVIQKGWVDNSILKFDKKYEEFFRGFYSMDSRNSIINFKSVILTQNLSPHCGQRGFAFMFIFKPKSSNLPKTLTWVKNWDMDITRIDPQGMPANVKIHLEERGKTYNFYAFIRRLYNIFVNKTEDKEVIYGCIKYY